MHRRATPQPPARVSARAAFPGVPCLLLLFSALMAVASRGFFETDEITHFLKARELPGQPVVLLDIWGRPACTGIFGVAATFSSKHAGLIAARLLAVGITALIGIGTVRVYRRLRESAGDVGVSGRTVVPDAPGSGAQAAWLWLLLFAQPLFLMNSFAVMTEPLLACAWIWAAATLLGKGRGRWMWAGLLVGLGGLARPEGWFAIALWPLLLVAWAKWAGAPHGTRLPRPSGALTAPRWFISSFAAGLPMLIWYIAGWVVYRSPGWFIARWPWQVKSQYGPTGAVFVAAALIALAVWMWVPVLIALGAAVRGARGGDRVQRRWLLLIGLPVVGFFVLHAVLGTFGWMGAMSLPRYFVAVSPFVALLAFAGVARMERLTRRPRLLRELMAVATVLPMALLVGAGLLPVPASTDARQMMVALSAYTRLVPRADQGRRLIAANPYVSYALDLPLDGPTRVRPADPAAIRDAPAGTYVLTDSLIWSLESRPSPAQLRGWGYVQDPRIAVAVDAVAAGFDPSAWRLTNGQVRLWVKPEKPTAAQ